MGKKVNFGFLPLDLDLCIVVIWTRIANLRFKMSKNYGVIFIWIISGEVGKRCSFALIQNFG